MGNGTLKDRAREELRSYALIAGYLYVCFAAIMLYKSALLREAGVGFLPHGIAAAKALILGKFILLGEAAGVGTRLRSTRTLIHAIAVKSLLFFVFLILLSVAEEFLVGRMRGHSFAQTLADYHFRARQYDKAARAYQKVVHLTPQNWQAWRRLAESYIALKQWDPALQTIDKASKGSGDKAFQKLRARALLSAHRYPEAQKTLEETRWLVDIQLNFCH